MRPAVHRAEGKKYMYLSDRVERLLTKVNKPASYMGGELNSVRKMPEETELYWGFCFPDLYEIGMSYLGLQIIYHVLNSCPGVYCQRIFAPGDDMEQLMRQENVPLFTVEDRQAASELDVLGFTLQYELSFTNIVNMLDLAGVPALSTKRSEDDPIIAAGGNCSFNPEPLSDIIDFFMIGDGEDVLIEVSELLKKKKKEGWTRREFLEHVSRIKGVYVPSFYEPQYGDDGCMTGYRKLYNSAPDRVVKRIVMDMDSVDFPLKPIVPFMETVHDRSVIELFRGCTRGCRFCQAGMICRPVRERSPELVRRFASESLANTGYDEMSLLSLSTSDYSQIEPLVRDLMADCKQKDTGLSLPSLRLDSFSEDMLREIQEFRKTGLTFAPEAGTQRLRNIINKSITDEHIYGAAEKVIKMGYTNIKLYFMVGLPGETDEDLDGIAEIAKNIVWLNKKYGDEKKKGRFNVTVSVSNFVPKADTPFQWAAQDSPDEFDRKHIYLKEQLRKVKHCSFQYHGTDTSELEAVLARGDRRLGKTIIRAWELGCKFDGWTEFFDFEKWKQAFADTGADIDFYAHRARGESEYLPWDIIDCGVTKKYMLHELHEAMNEIQTQDCRKGCTGCGLKRFVECPVYEQGANYS